MYISFDPFLLLFWVFVTSFIPGVYEQVNINDLATAIQLIDNNCLVTNAGFSTSAGGTYSNTLLPSAKNKQFVLSSSNIIILPIRLSPSTSTVVHTTGTVASSAIGGNGAYVYSISVNNSGGSINSSTGAYTAGLTGSVADTVLVTDALGNTATATVNVT